MGEILKPGEEYANWKAPDGGAEQPKPAEVEKSEIDFELYEQSLKNGTADEYRENAGALPAEALLEEQGDERVWSELLESEKNHVRELLKSYAAAHGLMVEEDDESCMVV
jgi:hypothetical protein